MPEPKKQTSKSKGKIRRKSKKKKLSKLVTCDNCGQKKKPHEVCPHCGFFKGEKVKDV